MSKLGNNPIMKGASGMLGKVVVFREQNGNLVMANRPKKRTALTAQQKLAKNKFLQAVQYAKAQMQDPNSKAEYEKGITQSLVSAYAVAVTDYLRGPEILEVGTKAYKGVVGDAIDLTVFDNFKVVDVTIELRSAADVLIEQGVAVQDVANHMAWKYVVTQVNNNVAGSKLIVRAKDKPGNVTTKEIVL